MGNIWETFACFLLTFLYSILHNTYLKCPYNGIFNEYNCKDEILSKQAFFSAPSATS